MDVSQPSAPTPSLQQPLWFEGCAPAPGKLARARMDSVAAMHALQAYDHSQLLPGHTTIDCIAAAKQLHPDKAAMVYLASGHPDAVARTVSYCELLDSVQRAAAVFAGAAGDQRSSVGILLPMLPESLIAVWGAQTAGIAIPINPHLETNLVIAILHRLQATVLVTTGDLYGPQTQQRIQAIHVGVPSLRRVLLVDAPAHPDDFASVLAATDPGSVPLPAATPDSEAMFMPTGGTTGAPKIVRMTHWGQLAIAWNVGALMGSTADGVVAHGMPNFHVGGTISLGLRTILYGQTLLTLTQDGFRNQEVVKNFWSLMCRYRVTSVLSTPTTAAAILSTDSADSTGHCITDFHCGGSPVPLELVRRFHQRFGVWLRENWGMTEMHGTVTGHPGSDHMPRVGSVGLPLPHYRVRAFQLDEDNRLLRMCEPNERGNLVIAGPSHMRGYRDASLDEAFFVKDVPQGETWANTGDLGFVDSDGYVWVSGRSKDLIIRGGHNIDPRLIEETLLAHEAVQLAAAIGRPDASKGELPIAYVELKPGASVSPQELQAFAALHTQERAAVPVEIIVLPAMPVTPVGKIAKPALRLDATTRVARAVAVQILGDSQPLRLHVEDTGKRLKVVLGIGGDAAEFAHISERLLGAFANFEFETECRPLP